jgi:hypothetical protein
MTLVLFLSLLSYTGNTSAQSKKAPAKKPAPAVASIPFDYSQSLIFIKAKVNGGRTYYLFLVNTGANTTVIDKRTAELLKLPVIREQDSVEGTAGLEYVTLCSVKAITAGNATVKNMEVTRRDLSKFVTLNGKKIDGILGTDFLKNFAVSFDFTTKRMAFSPKKASIAKANIMPFKMVDGIPRFTARLNDTFQTFLTYNSGVSMAPSRDAYINVSYEQWEQLRKLNPYIAHSNFVSGVGVGGDVYMQVVKIHNLQVCDLKVKSPYMVIQSKEGYFKRDDAVGFFGNNLLEKQRRVTVDFLNECIVLQGAKKPIAKPAKKGIIKKTAVKKKEEYASF